MTQCSSLAEVREHIDRLDRRIVPLLAERAGYVAQAAGFKPDKAAVVDTDRIEQIVLKVRHLANEEGMDPDLIEHIYRAMIEAYIVFEAKEYTRLHAEG
ncbi:chorismate mutase [Magnetospirillum sp. UT-4]|uniref:chorismate mutase n=1 Tax=Magnetospirillum sp. UT-4 TaxID=2681467 RepID=UPI00137D2A89|nr:chorismate mutase [Magnetospirillum sp. UT-4]CAA7621604.1 Salicylate biosynthesis protein pchB [Magnetospirillum sp. UT-4]